MTGDAWIAVCIVVLIIFFAGSPDLHDALISHLTKSCVPTP